MVQKITCPECNAEFDLGEGYKKHLEDLKAKTRAEVEKKTKDSVLLNTSKLTKRACFLKIKKIIDRKLNT